MNKYKTSCQTKQKQGWRDGSVVKSLLLLQRTRVQCPATTLGSLQPPTVPTPQDPIYSAPTEAIKHTYTYIK